MYNVLVISDKKQPDCTAGDKHIRYIGEESAAGISAGDCDVLIMDAQTAERLLRNNISICTGGVQIVVTAAEKFKDLKDAVEGAVFIDSPCGKEEIERIADECLSSAKMRRAKENFERMVLEEAERVKPIIREQFLRDYILGIGDADEIFKIYCKTFGVEYNLKTRMILLKTEPEPGFDEQFFVRNLVEGYLGKPNIMLCTAVKEGTLFVVQTTGEKHLTDVLSRAVKALERYYNYSASIVYSEKINLVDAPEVYEHLRQCISYCFYSNGEAIAYAGDIKIPVKEHKIEPDYFAIEASLKNAGTKKCMELLDGFFGEIERVKLDPAVAKTYCLELYVCVIRCCEAERIDKYMKGIMEFQSLKTLDEIRAYIVRIAKEIIALNMPEQGRSYSALISDTLQIIDKNIENENLSLRWLAGSILYTNVDYLGKLFKKEVGENFSHYVMKKRMEMAKKLILGGEKDRIYEVAEKVGYGSNSQYFSQVFKKYTGVSPLEYKEFSKQKKRA